jgi:hypothetical protein
MAFSYGRYTFNSQTGGDEANFQWTSKAGTLSTLSNPNTAGRWCWDNNATASSGVGPDYGQGGNPDGYVYTEMSSQVSGDQFIAEFETTIDTTSQTLNVDFYWCMRGNSTRATIEVQTREGVGGAWTTQFTTGYGDETIPGTNGATTWFNKVYDITTNGASPPSHATTYVRFLVTNTANPTSEMWHCDTGLDGILIYGEDLEPTISNADDEGFFNGETNIVITGTNFGASQGSGSVSLNSASDKSGTNVAQTVTSWADTSITITIAQGGLSNGTNYLFVTNDSSSFNTTGYTVTLDTRPTISNVGDEGFFNGETGVVITGTNFKSSQGDGTVSLNSASDGSGTNVAQTVTSWADTSITITIVQGGLSNGTNYLIVQNSNEVETAGYAIELQSRPTISNAGDEVYFDGETAIVIDGSSFESSQGTGYVEINSASNGLGTSVTQSVTSWGSSQIIITINQGALGTGTNYLIIHTDSNVESASYAISLHPRPAISDAEDELFYHSQTSVVIDGTDFGASQGGGSVELNTQSDGGGSTQTQTVTSWDDTQIVITINQGALSSGTLYLIVTSNTTNSSAGYSVSVYPRPTITDAEDETFFHGETTAIITGSNFGSSQGSGFIEINSASNGSGTSVVQSVDSWGDSSITITINQGSLPSGTAYFLVHADNGIISSGYSITLLDRPIISNAEDETYFNGETGVVIDGTGFGASQGVGSVELNTNSDGSGSSQAQTVTNWDDTQITITIIQGTLPTGTLYLIITSNAGPSSQGYEVTVAPAPTITDAQDEAFTNGETGVVIDGTNFGANQGIGFVELNTQSDQTGFSIHQVVTDWQNTQITFNVSLGQLPTGTLYLFVTNNYSIASTPGYEVIVNPAPSRGIVADWDIDYVANSPLTLAHDDGTLYYDSGSGTAPERDDYLFGSSSLAVSKILNITGTSASGFLTLTNTTLRFEDNESLVWMDSIGFDNVTNGGISVGDTITGVSSGKSGVVRFIEYEGTYGTAYSEQFGSGSWTDNENIQVGGQSKCLANGIGEDNSGSWTGVLVDGVLTPQTTTGIINYDSGTTLLIPEDAIVSGGTSSTVGLVNKQFGSLSTGSLRLNDTSDSWVNGETISITQVVNYDNQVSGKEFFLDDFVTGSISGASGRVIGIIDDGDSTGRIVLATQLGTFNHTSPDDLEVSDVKIAEVENNTFTLAVATTSGTLLTTQTPAQGGLYENSLNPVRPLNSLYTFLMNEFDELTQLDDDIPMSAQVEDQQYTMINNWKIPDLSMRFLDSGSLQDETEDNIWTNITTIGTLEGISDQSFASITPQPQIYLAQNNQILDPFWIEGHINVMVKVKTNTLSTISSTDGQLLNDGIVEVYVHNYGHSYSYSKSVDIGGVSLNPLSTSLDSQNTTATYSLDYDNESSGPFLEGELIFSNGYLSTGLIVSLDDQGSTGTIEYVLTSSVNFADNDGFVGRTSGAGADVAGAPTALVASYTDITLAFAAVSQDLGNGNGTRPYDCTIDCNGRPLAEVYEYLKFVTSKEYVGAINGNTGNQYQAVGDISLSYDTQTSNFTEGDLITGGSSDATGYLVADHDSGTTGFITLRQVSGIFQDNEIITDESGGSATVNGSPQNISRIEASPFGTLAGGKFFGARGVWIYNMAPSDSNNYELIDSTNTLQVPPSTIALTITNTVAGDKVSVFKTTGNNEIIDRQMFTVKEAHSIGLSYIRVLAGTVPADTPSTGTIRVVRRDGSGNPQGEERYGYTAWVTGGSEDQFTLSGTTTHAYDTNDTCYVPYIDEEVVGTSISKSLTYVTDRYVLTRVRIVGMLPFKVKGQITSTGFSVTTIRASDSVYEV